MWLIDGVSPQDSDAVLLYLRVRRQDRHAMHDGLCHDHAIEWVAMNSWQSTCQQCTFLITLERSNATGVSDLRDKDLRPVGQEQALGRILN